MTVPGFLLKLWSLVDDAMFDNVIRWTENGHSFRIVNEPFFIQILLPKYFKHSNLASFTRQLNKYGFRRVVTPKSRTIGKQDREIEYQHPLFRKGGSNLLGNIKRKDSKERATELQKIVAEMATLKEKHSKTYAEFEDLNKNYTALQFEMGDLKEKCDKQQQLLSQTLQFIGSLNENCEIDKNRERSCPATAEASVSNCACHYFHIPEEKKKEAMEIIKDGYAVLEDNYRSALTSVIPTDLISSVDQASGTDGKDHKMSSQDVSTSEGSAKRDLVLTFQDIEELMTKQYFGRELKDFALELKSMLPREVASTSTEDKSDMQCDTGTNRDEMSTQCTEENVVKLISLLPRNEVNCVSNHANETVCFEFPTSMANESETLLNIDTMPETQSVSVMENEESEISLLEVNTRQDEVIIKEEKQTPPSLPNEMPMSNFGEIPQDIKNQLLDDLENPPHVLPDSHNHNYIVPNLSFQEGVASSVENFVHHIRVESNGQYHLYPVLVLNPVTHLVEESIKTEPSD